MTALRFSQIVAPGWVTAFSARAENPSASPRDAWMQWRGPLANGAAPPAQLP